MQKVVSISLNGNSYQLEEPGYEQLRDYLERADLRLKDSPDRAEVMADLEQAIGEKCRAMLTPHKTVVSSIEVERIIAEMGPVESPDEKPADSTVDGAPNSGSSYSGSRPRKRLFKIREGEMFTGVCNGIAAYINVDVTWVRIGVTLLTVFSGAACSSSTCCWRSSFPTPRRRRIAPQPSACRSTPKNSSAAQKKTLRSSAEYRWRREWRRQQRHWNRQFRNMNEQLRVATAHAGPVVSQSARAIGGIFVVIAALVGALIAVVMILTLFSLLTQQSVFGMALPHGMPLWMRSWCWWSCTSRSRHRCA